MKQTDADIRKVINGQMDETGLSIADLARDLSISHQAVSQVIYGERGKIPQSLMNILERLNIKLKAEVVSDKQQEESAS